MSDEALGFGHVDSMVRLANALRGSDWLAATDIEHRVVYGGTGAVDHVLRLGDVTARGRTLSQARDRWFAMARAGLGPARLGGADLGEDRPMEETERVRVSMHGQAQR